MVETGILGYAAAVERAAQLQAEEDASHPRSSTWSKTLYIPEREDNRNDGT